MKWLGAYVRHHWGDLLLIFLLLVVIAINVKPGYFILGNDTYAPELNPSISLERYSQNPAWRSYRALGVPSDSEQADIVRVFTYRLLEFVLPNWAISQIYVFGAFFLAGWGMAQLAKALWKSDSKQDSKQIIGLIAGLLYVSSLVGAWMFASPLHPFLAAYAFLPLLLWRLFYVLTKPSTLSFLYFFVSILFITTSSMVPTIFIVILLMVLFFLFICSFLFMSGPWKQRIEIIALSLVVFLGSQLFWIVPFASYVKTNAPALAQSYINRSLTPNLIENEVKYSTFWNVPRYYFAWMDTTNDDGSKQYPFASWYLHSFEAKVISFLPLILALFGSIYTLRKKQKSIFLWIPLAVSGWILLAGVNPPFGQGFMWMQEHIPLFQQVFRWQSSKVFLLCVIPFAALGAYGVAWLTGRMHAWQKAVIITGIILIISLYVRHYGAGQLVNQANFVQVPQEYKNLAAYLEKTDPKSRIYLAPEANTLYFRSYTWGFFGSSLLNYIIPNPIIEKAMTTASLESEYAQQILEQAYNARQKDAFTRALGLYQTPYVLYDTSVARVHNGYFYEEDTAREVLENNQKLSLVWQDGSLRLYKLVAPHVEEYSLTPVYSNHHWGRLNTSLVHASASGSYVSSEDIIGTIYPLSLEFDSYENKAEALIVSATYHGPDGTFELEIPSQSSHNIVRLTFDESTRTLLLSRSLPQIRVRGEEVALPEGDPIAAYRIATDADLISVDTTVIDISDLPLSVEVATNEPRIDQWRSLSATLPPTQIEQSQASFVLPFDSIVSWNVSVEISEPTEVNICAYSAVTRTCVNKDHAVTILDGRPISLSIEEVLTKGDTITFYVKPTIESQDVSITHSQLLLHASRGLASPISVADSKQEVSSIEIRRGDRIEVSIPHVRGKSGYSFGDQNSFIPPIVHDSCATSSQSRLLRSTGTGPIRFTSLGCSDSLSVEFTLLYPREDTLGLIYWQGKNISGIPLKNSLSRKKAGYHHYEDLLPYEGSGSSLGFVPLPRGAQTYSLDWYSYGVGPRPSINDIDAFSFALIGADWYAMRLVPKEAEEFIRKTSRVPQEGKIEILGINQAVHPLWTMSGAKESVRINGWEQGWIVDSSEDTYSPIFTSNQWTFIGYGMSLAIGSCLLLWQMWRLGRKGQT
jgi:hypothetical protein